MKRPNLAVLTDAHATRVVLEDRRAVGVEVRQGQATVRLRAHREVILCARALQSPQLLLLSGVGDGEHLASLGIEVRHHLPGVGRNLHDHLASPVHMGMSDPTSYGVSLRAMPRNLVNLVEYALFRSGPLANNIFESAAFIKTVPGLDRPDVQLVFQPAKRPQPSFPFPLGHGLAISPVALYPRSRGRITLASPDPLVPPRIDPNLLSEPAISSHSSGHLRLVRQVFRARAFEKYRATETAPGAVVQSSEDARSVHPGRGLHRPSSRQLLPDGAGSAGRRRSALRVQGVDGLRVADAGVFPSIIGGNTNAAVVMIAEKAADLVLGGRRCQRSPPHNYCRIEEE